jgi:hypothetical protein
VFSVFGVFGVWCSPCLAFSVFDVFSVWRFQCLAFSVIGVLGIWCLGVLGLGLWFLVFDFSGSLSFWPLIHVVGLWLFWTLLSWAVALRLSQLGLDFSGFWLFWPVTFLDFGAVGL